MHFESGKKCEEAWSLLRYAIEHSLSAENDLKMKRDLGLQGLWGRPGCGVSCGGAAAVSRWNKKLAGTPRRAATGELPGGSGIAGVMGDRRLFLNDRGGRHEDFAGIGSEMVVELGMMAFHVAQ